MKIEKIKRIVYKKNNIDCFVDFYLEKIKNKNQVYMYTQTYIKDKLDEGSYLHFVGTPEIRKYLDFKGTFKKILEEIKNKKEDYFIELYDEFLKQ